MMEIPQSRGVPIQGEYNMGRPIQGRWFGPASLGGQQIIVDGVKFADGTTATDAYIVKQTGSSAYIVSNGTKAEIVFMVNANGLSALMPGQCYINATPFGGTALPCKTIAQYRASLYTVPNSVPRIVGDPAVVAATDYVWSTIPATRIGECDLITDASGMGAVTAVTIVLPGFGYFTAPTVTITGDGSGATATATVANGIVTGVSIGDGGSNYTTASVAFDAPPASVTATGTVTLNGGAVDSISVDNAGANGYYTTAPTVTISGNGNGATATAVVSAGRVTSITVDTPGTSYTSATVTIADPSAEVTATGTVTL